MEIKVLENSKTLVRVEVDLPIKRLAVDRDLFVGTTDVRNELKRQNIDVMGWSASGSSTLNNFGTNSKLHGEWVFEKSVPKPLAAKTKPETEEKVEEEADVPTEQPSNRRRRRPGQATRKEDKLFGTEDLE